MPDDSTELRLARAYRDEGEQLRKEAAADLASAKDERAHAERRHRDIAALEQSVTKREAALKAAGEPAFLARMAAADKALAEAKAIKADYDAAKHGAMVALQAIDARERAERSAA
jgi:hypothetical protein